MSFLRRCNDGGLLHNIFLSSVHLNVNKIPELHLNYIASKIHQLLNFKNFDFEDDKLFNSFHSILKNMQKQRIKIISYRKQFISTFIKMTYKFFVILVITLKK